MVKPLKRRGISGMLQSQKSHLLCGGHGVASWFGADWVTSGQHSGHHCMVVTQHLFPSEALLSGALVAYFRHGLPGGAKL